MTNQVSMPFQPDRPAPLPPLRKPDPVRDGARAYRRQLAEDYKSELAELRSYAEQEWHKYRADHPFADNHTEYVDAIIESLAPEPPPRLANHEAFRLSLPYALRLPALGEHKVFDEFAKVSAFRAGGQISLETLRNALMRYARITDAELLQVIDAAELTLRQDRVLFITGAVEADRGINLPSLPLNVTRPLRDLLATEDERLSPEDF